MAMVWVPARKDGDVPPSRLKKRFTQPPLEHATRRLGHGQELLRRIGWDGGGLGKTPGRSVPYIPEARPSGLGLGAKAKAVVDTRAARPHQRPDRRHQDCVVECSECGEQCANVHALRLHMRSAHTRKRPRKRDEDEDEDGGEDDEKADHVVHVEDKDGRKEDNATVTPQRKRPAASSSSLAAIIAKVNTF